jgi:hypothetical protein
MMRGDQILDELVKTVFDTLPAAPAVTYLEDVAFVIEQQPGGKTRVSRGSRTALVRQFELDTKTDEEQKAEILRQLRPEPREPGVIPVVAFAYQRVGAPIVGVRWRKLVVYAGSA